MTATTLTTIRTAVGMVGIVSGTTITTRVLGIGDPTLDSVTARRATGDQDLIGEPAAMITSAVAMLAPRPLGWLTAPRLLAAIGNAVGLIDNALEMIVPVLAPVENNLAPAVTEGSFRSGLIEAHRSLEVMVRAIVSEAVRKMGSQSAIRLYH